MLSALRLVSRPSYGQRYKPNINTVIWYPGQDDAPASTIADRSGNSLDGTITGAVWTRTSQGTWYLDFDGSDDKIATAATPLLSGATKLTVKAWVNVTTLKDYAGVCECNVVAGTDEIFMSCAAAGFGGNNHIFLPVRNAANTYGYTDAALIAEGSWQHWCMVFNGAGTANADRLKFYFNGINRALTFSGTIPASLNLASAPIRFSVAGTAFLDCNIALELVTLSAWSVGQALNSYNQELHFFE